MASGDLTVTLVGNYDNLVLAIAAMTAGNDALATDSHKLVSTGGSTYAVIKYAREA